MREDEKLQAQSARPTIGLCVIVKDGAASLRACLDSVNGLADRMVVVDTGSDDGSQEIAAGAGAEVLSHPWAGDFSAARNAALAAIGTEWVLVLDADEELDADAKKWIRQEIADPQFGAYLTPVRNYLRPWDQPLANQLPVPRSQQHERARDATHYLHSEVCRLFRRTPGVRYSGIVHEQVEESLRELGVPIGRAGFFIHHFGWYEMAEANFLLKFTFYRELLQEKLRESPADPQVMVQLADLHLNAFEQPEAALPLLLKAAEIDARTRELWMHLAMCLRKLGQPEAALLAARQISADGELAGKRAQLEGEILAGLSWWEEACVAYRLALHHYPDNTLLRAGWAHCETKAGRPDEGLRQMEMAIAAAEADIRRMPCAQTYLRSAELHAQSQRWEGALQRARAGLARSGCALQLEQLRLKAAVALGALSEAAEAAGALLVLDPSPRMVLRQAAVLSEAGRQHDAHHAVCAGLRAFPESTALLRAERELSAHAFATAASSSPS